MDNFLQISFRLQRELDDFIQNNILNFDIYGLEIDDPVEKQALLDAMPTWEITDIKPVDDGYISYKVFFEDSESGISESEGLVAFLEEKIDNFQYESKHIDNSNWEEEWKKSYTAFPIGHKIWIKPSWEKDYPSDRILIEIEPKTAFGSGTHETTALCMAYVEEDDLSGLDVLDMGCGSGILSILASKLGAKQIDAVDIDPFAIENAKDNARINGVSNMSVFYSDLFSDLDKDYDLIFANILAEILVDMLDSVDKHLKVGGRLVLSGIIEGKESLVKDKIQAINYEIIDEIKDGEWVLISAKRKE